MPRRPKNMAHVARIGLAAAKIEENAFDRARAILQECPPALRNWEWGRLVYLCERAVRDVSTGERIEAVAYSPDGSASPRAVGAASSKSGMRSRNGRRRRSTASGRRSR